MKFSLCKRLLAGVIACAAVSAAAYAAPFKLVKIINPTGQGIDAGYMVANDTNLIFWAYDGVSGPKGGPWVSDGTSSGTHLISQIAGTSAQFIPFQPPFSYGGFVYFTFYDGLST